MSWIEFLVAYLIIWWPIFFCILPFGNSPMESSKKDDFFAGTPARPRILKKFIIASLITLFLTSLLWFSYYLGLFSFKSLFIE